ncbi:MAG: nicotinate (nicotinamide) nucleotide adenylyltransferase [Bacteroidota bacterium]|nr:nicotinate (nicotinamide) nucleotide adenylyltransferase [Bacteroidota bacterium]
MKIGLYFGSFNPVHIGHLIIANYTAYNTDIDQVWFVISPQNPLKPQTSNLNKYHRKYLIDLAIEGENKLRSSTIEFALPIPSYTIDTLSYLKEEYPLHIFAVIIGSDSLQNIHKWKNYELLIHNYELLVYERPGFPINTNYNNVTKLKGPLLDISSTDIRDLIKKRGSIKFLVPDLVKEEIEKNHYYK